MLAASLLFARGVATSYAPLLRADPRESVLVPERELGVSARRAMRADVLFATWLVGRHARTLATRPQRLRRIAAALPGRGAVRELRRLGFTSLVVHPGRLPLATRFARQARRGNSPLRVLREGEGVAVFELREAGEARVVESPDP